MPEDKLRGAHKLHQVQEVQRHGGHSRVRRRHRRKGAAAASPPASHGGAIAAAHKGLGNLPRDLPGRFPQARRVVRVGPGRRPGSTGLQPGGGASAVPGRPGRAVEAHGRHG
eukprot:868660-Heterocapsa_arctica.AAC.1